MTLQPTNLKWWKLPSFYRNSLIWRYLYDKRLRDRLMAFKNLLFFSHLPDFTYFPGPNLLQSALFFISLKQSNNRICLQDFLGGWGRLVLGFGVFLGRGVWFCLFVCVCLVFVLVGDGLFVGLVWFLVLGLGFFPQTNPSFFRKCLDIALRHMLWSLGVSSTGIKVGLWWSLQDHHFRIFCSSMVLIQKKNQNNGRGLFSFSHCKMYLLGFFFSFKSNIVNIVLPS